MAESDLSLPRVAQFFELYLQLEYPDRKVSVFLAAQPWLFHVTVGATAQDAGWASFLFEMTEPARDAADRWAAMTMLGAAVRKMLATHPTTYRPQKVTLS